LVKIYFFHPEQTVYELTDFIMLSFYLSHVSAASPGHCPGSILLAKLRRRQQWMKHNLSPLGFDSSAALAFSGIPALDHRHRYLCIALLIDRVSQNTLSADEK
jgi:hypothetical protein